MQKALATTLCVAATLAAAGQAAAETGDPSALHSVAAEGRIRVEVSEGANYAIDVSGRDASRVHTRIEGTALRISGTNRSWFGGDRPLDAVVHVIMPEVDGLAATRGAVVSASAIEADEVSVAASMGGQVRIAGVCRALSAAASMGGIVHAGDLHCADANVATSMGGRAEVYADDHSDVAAAMGGSAQTAGEGGLGEVRASDGASNISRN